MAHKKGMGSTKNGRDSDIDGKVKFERMGKDRKMVSVYEEIAQ